MATIKKKTGDLDRILMAMSEGDTVELDSGLYTTRGAWAFRERDHISLPNGCSIIAKPDTIIRLENAEIVDASGKPREDRDLPILWAGSGTTIKGGVWDCNFQGHPGMYTQGLRFHGVFDIRNARIIGMSGTRAVTNTVRPVESFAISSTGKTGGSTVTSVTVDSCKAGDKNDYVSGIFVGSTEPSDTWSYVIDCKVHLGDVGQFGFACNGATEFTRCLAHAMNGFYNDTGSTVAQLRECELEGAYAAVSMVGVDKTKRLVRLIGCDLSGARGVEWYEKSGSMDGTIIAISCKINAEWLAAIKDSKAATRVSFWGCKKTGGEWKISLDGAAVPPGIA